MNKFDLLTFEKMKNIDGVQAIVEFPNGWGASMVKSDMSYGGKSGLFEIAVLDKDGKLSYETDIADDVIGWQDEKDIDRVLTAISKLDSDGVSPKKITT